MSDYIQRLKLVAEKAVKDYPLPNDELSLGANAVLKLISEYEAIQVKLETATSLLVDLRPYVDQAYECAFPDHEKNVSTLERVDTFLAPPKQPCKDCFACKEAEQNPDTLCDSCGWAESKNH